MKLTIGLRMMEWLCELLIKRLIEPTKKKIERQQRFSRFKDCASPDTKCPGCDEWFSAVGVRNHVAHISFPSFGSHVRCGDCGTQSYWNYDVAPVPLWCDSTGMPILEESSRARSVIDHNGKSMTYWGGKSDETS
jgi:hypothetical protein